VATDEVDWETTLEVEIDPKLAEAIHSRARLRQITLRVEWSRSRKPDG